MAKRYSLVLILLGLLLSCGQEPVAGGSPGETTNGIAGIVLDQNDVPLASARVFLYRTPSMTKIDSQLTDSVGAFRFENVVGNVAIEVVSSDQMTKAWIANPVSENRIVAKSLVEFWIVLDPLDTAVCNLVGTPFVSKPKGGLVHFGPLAEGLYILGQAGRVTQRFSVVAGVTDTIRNLDWINSVRLEDFNDGDRRPLYANYWPSYVWVWWLGLDSTATAVFPKSMDKLSTAMSDSGAYEGKSLHVKYRSKAPWVYPIQWIGFKLGSRLDFTHLDSVTLMVRGNGKVALALETLQDPSQDQGLFPNAEVYQKSAWEQSVTSEWSRVVFRMTDTMQPDLATAPWSVMRSRVDQISVFFLGGDEIYIDNLDFHGIESQDFALKPSVALSE